MNLESAYSHCLRITRNHYENFPVASWLIPVQFRRHIAAVYAFARTADDFSDEYHDRDKLMNWREQLHNCTKKSPKNPIFLALANTIKQFDLPIQYLDNLLTAFLWDLDKKRFKSFDELHEYCHYSANPVGRIVLWLFGFRSEKILKHSDAITTALQLTNFWQDISVDLKKDRIYIPRDYLMQYRVNEGQIFQGYYDKHFYQLMDELIKKTYYLFQEGKQLFSQINGRLKLELKFTVMGGKTILTKVFQNKQTILHQRPTLSKWDWTKIVFQTSLNSV